MENAWGVSPFTLQTIKNFEGYAPKPAWDFAQHSVGWGTRWNPGDPIGTRADHEAALAREAGNVNGWLNQNVTTPLNDNQRAALTSAGFNLGYGDKGIGRLLPDINAGNWDTVASRLKTFNKAGGEVNPGLVNRRQAEAQMLLGGRRPTLADAMSSGFMPGGISPSAMPSGTPVPGVPGQPVAAGAMPDALTPPSQRYSKLADALMASAAGAKPTGWGSALNAFGDAALGYSLANKGEEQQKTYNSKLAQLLSGANTSEGMTQAAIASGDPDLQKVGFQAKMASLSPKAKKDRYLVTPSGVFDLESSTMVKGTQKENPDDTLTVNGRVLHRDATGKYSEVYNTPQQLTAADHKEIYESDAAAQAGKSAVMTLTKALELNDKANYGPLAQTRGYAQSLFGSEAGKATEDLNNMVTSQALDQLKATFGGMPTEGERKILLDIQGSTNQSPDVRKNIWERAIQMANRRIEFNQRQSDALRTGKYFQPGYSPVAPDAVPEAQVPPIPERAPGAPDAPKAPPAPAIQFLKAQPTPENIAQFEAKYGPGSAKIILGQQPPAQPQQPPAFDASTLPAVY